MPRHPPPGRPYSARLTRLEDRIVPAATPVGPLLRPYSFTEVLAFVQNADRFGSDLDSTVFDSARRSVIFRDTTGSLIELGIRPGTDPLTAVGQLERQPGALWASPNHIVYGEAREFTPNDPSYGSQYFHTKMQNDKAWDVTTGSPSVIIAVTDDGIAVNHPDLQPNIWVNAKEIAGNGVDDDGNGFIDDVRGWDFSSNDNDPNPVNSDTHGTHVAGIAAARTNNGVGVAGTAGGGPNGDGVRLMPVRFYGSGAWTASVIAKSFAYAADNGAKIITTSYNFDGWVSGTTPDPVVNAGLNYSYGKGVLHFLSAGNNGALDAPRRVFEQGLFVANTNSSDVRASSSNYGKFVDIAAPGSTIFATTTSTGGTTYTYGNLSGTSMATPNAAAAAGLIWSANPTWTREQVVARLLGTADNIDAANPGFAGLLGTGRVNSFRAVTENLAPPRLGAVIGLPAEGASVAQLPTTFTIDVPNRFDPATVVNASFELLGDGPDNVFGTSDDTKLALTINGGSAYLVGTNTLTFTVSGSAPADRYRFRAVSGGLRDPFNVSLDGNGDGIAGDDFTRTFFVDRAVEGTVFHDRNGNGLREAGEEPLGAGWVVYDDANGNGSFDTGGGSFSSTNVPVSIPDNTTVTSTLSVAGVVGAITDLNVSVNITHTYNADLDIFLIAPDGTRIELSTDNGGSGDNYTNTVFDDQAVTAITAGKAPFTGSFRPEGSLAIMNGKSANGIWTLEVSDDANTDTGTINGWSVIIEAASEASTTTTADGQFVFSTLPPAGPHTLRLAPRTGFSVTTAAAPVTVAAGSTALANLGAAFENSVYGRLFDDLNGNGVNDAEPALPNWQVFLDADDNGVLNGFKINPSSSAVVAINDNATSNSTISVSGISDVISSLTVTINITHTYTADLDIFLVSPLGTRIELSTDNGGAGLNFTNTTFDDNAAIAITAGAAPFTGSFQPETPLSALTGQSPNGVWTLEVTDDAGGDIGTIDNWSLSIAGGERTATTDANGSYRFDGLPAGAHVIRRILAPGYVSTAPASGSHSITHNLGAVHFNRDFAQRIPTAAPAKVASVAVNGGAVQRSMVTSLQVAFDQIVSFSGNPAAAFLLSRQGGGSVALAAAIDNSGAGTVATLTFTGGEVDPGSASLRDGRYTLSIDTAQVSTVAGALDGDGDGTPGGAFQVVGEPATAPKLYRLFGDINGNNVVEPAEFLAFRLAFFGASPEFDVQNDGLVDPNDFLAFRLRFLQSV